MIATHFTIDHQVDQQRFCITISEDAAVLEYKQLNSETLDFTRTYVPQTHRGQGHAEALVRAGLAWAKEQGYTITASCWYVDKFLKRERA